MGRLIADGQSISIIPTPQLVIPADSFFQVLTLDHFHIETIIPAQGGSVVENAQSILRQTLDSLDIAYEQKVIPGDQFQLLLRRSKTGKSENIPGNFTLHQEGYWLKILPDEILGEATDAAGYLYLILSLRQLFYGTVQAFAKIPCATIIDYPSFSFRGVMDDISRGPLPHLDFMKYQIRRMASYKINVFSFYIEHVLKTEKHHTFAPAQGLTIHDLDELQDYAASYNIKIMGSFQSLGHFRNILRHPEYASLGIGDRMLYPGSAQSLAFLKDMYSAMLPVSSHSIFNINCDEAYDLARGPLKAIAAEEGEGTLFARHVTPLLEFVAGRGKRPGMWGDMLLKYREILPLIPKETVIFTWNYDANSSFDDWIVPFKKQGFDVIACPGIVNSYRLWPDLIEAKNNIKRFTTAAFEHDIKGTLCTVWDDGGRHFFNTDWYGVCYAGAMAWNADSTAHSDFDGNYDLIHFQDTVAAFTDLLHRFARLQSIDRLQRLNNYLVEMNFGSAQMQPEYIDTSDFTIIKKSIQGLLKDLQRHDHKVSTRKLLFPNRAHEIWDFKGRELLLNIKTAESLLQTSLITRESLCEMVGGLVEEWLDIRNHFTRLWRSENRSYWLETARSMYHRKIEILQQLSALRCENGMGSDTRLEKGGISTSFEAGHNVVLQYWLGAGPFAADGGLYLDYLASSGGEREIRPAAIDYFQNQDGEDQGWNKIISSRPGLLHFSDFYGIPMKNAVAYASASMESDIEKTIAVRFSTGSPTLLFVNGKLILDAASGEINTVKLPLKQGRNYLLVKSLCRDSSNWHFSLQVLQEHVAQNKYKYYLQ